MNQTSSIQKLLRPSIRAVTPYSSARSEFSGKAEVFLDANENSFGSPISHALYNRYPDPLQKRLKEKISGIKGVAAESIFVGNGSDEAIDLLIRAFCEPGMDLIMITPPTYGMYEVSAAIHNAGIVSVPLLRGDGTFLLDVEAIIAATTSQTKLLFICNPNNPTGTVFPAEIIKKILDIFPGIVVVDEAYNDFTPDSSFIPKLSAYPRLVVIQTLSKAWGLAGLRLGMAFASPELIRVLNTIKPPYNINTVTQELALAGLNNAEWFEATVQETLQQREMLEQELRKSPHVQHIYPSGANFILVRVSDAPALYQAFVRAGIIVRDRSQVQLCEGCLRITVGTAQENNRLVETLQQWK